jgi:hypothetical protein
MNANFLKVYKECNLRNVANCLWCDEASRRSSEFEWFKRFEDASADLLDDQNSGPPSTSRNEDTIADVREMVTRDRRWALRMMSDELNINKETIRQILEDLQKRKLCAKFVPHRLALCQGFIQARQDNPSFLHCNLCFLR